MSGGMAAPYEPVRTSTRPARPGIMPRRGERPRRHPAPGQRPQPAPNASSALEAAGVRDAAAVVVAPDRDDTAVLITLTARELNPSARIVASVREGENAHLLEQGGADSVVVSSGAAGRLLGHAVRSPKVVQVLEDLLSVGEGLDVMEREVTRDEAGRPLAELPATAPVIAVVRGEEVLRFDDPRAAELRAGDRLVCLCSNA